MTTPSDDIFMQRALRLAEQTGQLGNIPVGAVVVREGKILGEAANLRHTLQDPTAHAELIAIRAATQAAGSWRLSGATLYVTLEPCPMCAGALLEARFDRVVYGASDPHDDRDRMLLRKDARIEVQGGVLEPACRDTLQGFFSALRKVDPVCTEGCPSG